MFRAISTSTTARVLAAVLAAAAGQAHALGLGDITLHSSLGQPLSADIALVDAQGLGAADLSVGLATADEFARAGVDRAFFLNDLHFTPVLSGSYKFIHVTTSKAVTEPYLDFLVQLNRPSGQLLREFTVLIDPPGTVALPPAPKFDDAPVSSIASALASANGPTPTARAAAAQQPAAAAICVVEAIENEIAEAVHDGLAAVDLRTLRDMRVAADDQAGPLVDQAAGKAALPVVRQR